MHSRHDSERSDAFISQFKKKEREKKKHLLLDLYPYRALR